MRQESEPTSVGAAVEEVLRALRVADLAHAMIREPTRDGRGILEADLLVDPDRRVDVERVLARLGFRERPSWGRHPHHFHLRPVVSHDQGPNVLDWLKVDLVTDICFGAWHELTTDSAGACLAAPERPAGRLAPADELAALLLHGLLDGGGLSSSRRDRLAELAPTATDPGILASRCAPEGAGFPTWSDLVGASERREWSRIEAVTPVLRGRLLAGRRAAVGRRRVSNVLARRSVKLLTAVAGRGPLVALVGPDGTGKTTLAQSVAASCVVPGRVLYGGTYRSGSGSNARFPGMATAAVARRLLTTRVHVAWHRARGRLVVLDRHPVEARALPGEELATRAKVRRRLLAATLPTPDLLLALDAPATLLHGRRPEHDVEHLESDRIRHLDLVERTPGAEVVDATGDREDVHLRTVGLIWARAIGRDQRRRRRSSLQRSAA